MIDKLTNTKVIDQCYEWLCKQRKHFPADNDIWHLRFNWHSVKPWLIYQLRNNQFNFQPVQRMTKSNGEIIHLWSSLDSLVFKMMATQLSVILPSSQLCTHLKGNGGSKYTVCEIQKETSNNKFVFRTDVKSYYASIDHETLLRKLETHINDKLMMNLTTQYIKRCVEYGGVFTDIRKGISSGCPLSPLIASFYLYELDKEMEKQSVFYRRYMDDIIVLSPSRWKLRKAIKTVNQHFKKLKLEQHPDKTYIGRIEKGFDFLGYQFGEEKLTVSKRTLNNHIRRITQLYEQKKHQTDCKVLLDDYRRRWVRWVYSGIPSSIIGNVELACLTTTKP